MGNWNTLLPVDRTEIRLGTPDNNPLTFEGSASGYLSSLNYNDTYPVHLVAGNSYDFITVNDGSGYGSYGAGLYGVWTDILVYDRNGDLIDINRATSLETVGYDGDIFDLTVATSGTYYVSVSMYFNWDSGAYSLFINADSANTYTPPTSPTTPTTPTTPATPTPPATGALGTDGNDSLTGASSGDSITGGAGNDSIFGFGSGDVLYGNQDADLLDGGDGSDTLFGGQGNDSASGAAGDDQLFGNMADDVLSGGDGADSLFGGQGGDTLSGGDGNDWLVGNLGDDTMTGGGGGDTFAFRVGQGSDLITDFSFSAGDRIEITRGMDYTVMLAGAGSRIQFDSGDYLMLAGVTPSQVADAWFVIL